MTFVEHSRTIIGRFVGEIEFYRQVLSHPGTPRLAKILMGAAIAYALSPLDLIPDVFPVEGHLDDLVILPLLIWAAVRLIPESVIPECRQAK
jgi:uncharacterized membrane protein YkvA (DUF1232 family)